jgi:NAD(P)-dependent dehydrogenase (short-subunit alcohol dehydrogenase family)
MELNGRVALVTGAGSGLGEAIALAFAQAGATLALLDLTEAAARATLEAAGCKASQSRPTWPTAPRSGTP